MLGISVSKITTTILAAYINAIANGKILNAAEYGVPQNRKRIIILGLSIDEYGTERAKQMLKNFYENKTKNFFYKKNRRLRAVLSLL